MTEPSPVPVPPQQPDEWLYKLVQASPCIIISLVVLVLGALRKGAPNLQVLARASFVTLCFLAVCLGFARLFAYAAPKRKRARVTGFLYVLFVLLLLLGHGIP